MNSRKIKVFGKPGCPGCLAMHPILMEVVQEGLEVEFYMKNQEPDLFESEKIVALPTINYYDSGVLYSRTVGEVPKSEIIRIYNRPLDEKKSIYETRHEEYGW